MRILGIDPGYATIGFGLITAERAQVNMLTYGAITTPAGLPLSRRLYQIGTDMEDLIGQLKPDVISIEELFFNTNLTTGIAVAHARGVLLYTAEKCGIPLHEYTLPGEDGGGGLRQGGKAPGDGHDPPPAAPESRPPAR